MKILVVVLALIATTHCHQFFAEDNFICRLCEESLKLISQEKFATAKLLLRPYAKAMDLLVHKNVHLDAMNIQGKSPKEVCEEIKMCGTNDFEDFVIDHNRIIEEVNSMKTSWYAAPNQRFVKSKASDVRKTLGTIVDPNWLRPLPQLEEDYSTILNVPDTFDSRTNWATCTEIAKVRDQANCGSCWAFGTTEAFNDRTCIQGGDKTNTLLSTADTTACCGFMSCQSQGCNGGQIGSPWNWFHSTGVVTGGQFDDTTTCFPYTMPECEHHVPGTKKNCADIKQVNPRCSKTCTGDKALKYETDKHKASARGYELRSVSQIKSDIYAHGPVTGAFTVYEDFLAYKSGVYQHKTGKALGGHAIKVIGWGKEDGLDYWLVMNSWNTDWGDKGLFKIVLDEIDQFAAGAVTRTVKSF